MSPRVLPRSLPYVSESVLGSKLEARPDRHERRWGEGSDGREADTRIDRGRDEQIRAEQVKAEQT